MRTLPVRGGLLLRRGDRGGTRSAIRTGRGRRACVPIAARWCPPCGARAVLSAGRRQPRSTREPRSPRPTLTRRTATGRHVGRGESGEARFDRFVRLSFMISFAVISSTGSLPLSGRRPARERSVSAVSSLTPVALKHWSNDIRDGGVRETGSVTSVDENDRADHAHEDRRAYIPCVDGSVTIRGGHGERI